MLETVRKCAPNAYLAEPLMIPAHAAALMSYKNSKELARR
jgi:hypothetical protein